MTDVAVQTAVERHIARRRPFGRKRRRIALLFLAIGLATFFQPLITTDSAVLNRTRWSPLAIVEELHAGRLSVGDLFFAPVEVYGIYLLFFALLIAVIFSRPQSFFLAVSLLAAVLCAGVWRWGNADFERLFYGFVGLHNRVPKTVQDVFHRSANVHQLVAVLSLVCAVLVFLCFHENLDEDTSPAKIS